MPGTFDGFRKQALVRRADPTDSPWQYFPAFGNKMAQEFSVLEIDIGYFFRAELAHSFAPNAELLGTWHSIWPFYLCGSENLGPDPLTLMNWTESPVPVPFRGRARERARRAPDSTISSASPS